MAKLYLSSSFSAAYEKRAMLLLDAPENFGLTSDFAAQIAEFEEIQANNDPRDITLKSKEVSVEYRVGGETWELELTGKGLGPISTIDQFLDSLDSGLARGELDRLRLERDGDTVIRLDIDRKGYELTSGKDYFKIKGAVPDSFAEFFDLTGLLDMADFATLSAMTQRERTQYFNALADYGIASLTIGSGKTELFEIEFGRKAVSVGAAGLTLKANGKFPDDLGAVASSLYTTLLTLDGEGDVEVGLLADYDVSSLQILEGKRQLAKMVGPFDPMAEEFTQELYVDGFAVDPDSEVIAGDPDAVGSNEDDVMFGSALEVSTENERGDNLSGRAGRDLMLGLDGHDILDGGTGNDILVGGKGRDTMIGGDGDDFYIVDDSRDSVEETEDGGSDAIESGISLTLADWVETLILDGKGNLRGTGNGLDNILVGNSGNNVLRGMGGDDLIDGGAGRDTLSGGAGADTFLFLSAGQTGARAPDLITDFESGLDAIDLSAIDANTRAAGDQEFTFIGRKAFKDAGDLRFQNEMLSGDVNGDRRADFTIKVEDIARLSVDDLFL